MHEERKADKETIEKLNRQKVATLALRYLSRSSLTIYLCHLFPPFLSLNVHASVCTCVRKELCVGLDGALPVCSHAYPADPLSNAQL